MNNISSNYNGGTLLEVGVLTPALSGASPTSYFCGNLIWKQLVQQKNIPTTSEELIQRKPEEVFTSTIFVPNQYSELHVLACQGNMNSKSSSSYLEQCSSVEINKQDHNGNTALIWATLQNQEETIQLLLDNQAYVNAQNFIGETSLFLAASYGYDNIVSILLEYGANPNICNLDGTSPLHMAAANGHENILEILFRSGAYLNCQDDCGDTPLHYAIRDEQLKIVEQLITRCNADVNICNEDQETPMDLASCLGMNEKYNIQFLSSNNASNGSSIKMMDNEEANWI